MMDASLCAHKENRAVRSTQVTLMFGAAVSSTVRYWVIPNELFSSTHDCNSLILWSFCFIPWITTIFFLMITFNVHSLGNF